MSVAGDARGGYGGGGDYGGYGGGYGGHGHGSISMDPVSILGLLSLGINLSFKNKFLIGYLTKPCH